jgi:hypothetical protein
MPLPPAMPDSGGRGRMATAAPKRPCGSITCIVSPGFQRLVQPGRERAAGHARTPTRSSPSSMRRRSSTSGAGPARPRRAQRQVLARLEGEGVAQRGRARRRTRPSRRRCRLDGLHAQGWKCSPSWSDRWSDRLEVFEGFAAVDAAVQRLAGGDAEGRQPFGLRAAAARAVDVAAWMRIRRAPSCTAVPVGGAMPYARSLRRPSSLIQSVVQAGARRVLCVTGAKPAAPVRVHALRDDLGGRAAAVGGRQHHLDARRRRRLAPRARCPGRTTDSAGTSGSAPGQPPRRSPRARRPSRPSPGAPGCWRCSDCISARMKPMCSLCTPLLAGADEGRVGGSGQRGLGQHACTSASHAARSGPGRAQAADAAASTSSAPNISAV